MIAAIAKSGLRKHQRRPLRSGRVIDPVDVDDEVREREKRAVSQVSPNQIVNNNQRQAARPQRT
jgi:hypothetical protein